MTPLQLIQYYANLLVLQYLQKPKAYATAQAVATPAIFPQTSVQLLSFSGTPVSGTFVLNYLPFGANQTSLPTAAINWNDSASAVQTKIQAVSGLGSVTVTGSVPAGLTVTFTGVNPVANLFTVTSNSLVTSAPAAITITVAETDVSLPLALSLAHNISPALGATAIGGQLDTLGKYVGVTRMSSLTSGPITLNDTDFLSLIQFAALKNSAGSSLATIQALLNQFFPNEIFVFDYQNMQMSYLINSNVGSANLALTLVAEGLLFRPMGVALATTIYGPIITFFGFRTYDLPGNHVVPFNTYDAYILTWPFLLYSNGLF